MSDKRISIQDALQYEAHASPIYGYVKNPLLQTILAAYLARVVSRKYGRYIASLEMKAVVGEMVA